MADFNLGPYRIRPRGLYNPAIEYQYLDMVKYKGNRYLCVNLDCTDEVSCIGVLPDGAPNSELYWDCIGEKGDKGDSPDIYTPFITLSDANWDFSKGDKCIIPEDASVGTKLNITNIYDGCCGLILTRHNLELPDNSMKSADFDYLLVHDGAEYYCYTFVCVPFIDGLRLIWHRSVVTA